MPVNAKLKNQENGLSHPTAPDHSLRAGWSVFPAALQPSIQVAQTLWLYQLAHEQARRQVARKAFARLATVNRN